MCSYNLEKLFEDAGHRCSGCNASSLNLKEVWAAVDRYAVACLEQKRGVSLPNLCRVGWQVLRLREKCSHKPYFQLSEAFCRVTGVNASKGSAPPPPENDLCTIEEFNFSKAAIKFSGQLVKDQMFTGWRLLVRQISDVIGQGRSLELEFSFGKLVAKDRVVHFVFAADLYIAHGLEVPSGAADDIEYRPSATFSNADNSRLQDLNLKGTGVREQVSTATSRRSGVRDHTGMGSSSRSRGMDMWEQRPAERFQSSRGGGMFEPAADGGGISQQMATDGWAYRPEGKADVLTLYEGSAGTRNVKLDECGVGNFDGDSCNSTRMPTASGQRGNTSDAGYCNAETLAEYRQSQRAGAYELALHKHLSDLESLASQKMSDKVFVQDKLQHNLADDALAESCRQAQVREYATYLQEQIQSKEYKHTRSACEAPDGQESESTPSVLASFVAGLGAKPGAGLLVPKAVTPRQTGSTPSVLAAFVAGLERPGLHPELAPKAGDANRGAALQRASASEVPATTMTGVDEKPATGKVRAPVSEAVRAKPLTGLHRAPISEKVGSTAGGSTASSARPPNALRDALDEQVQAKRTQQENLKDMDRRFEARMVEADNKELRAFREFEQDSRAARRASLTEGWQEAKEIKDMFKAISSVSGRRGSSSGLRSSRGTPRSSQLAPGSARGPNSIGAAASLALQMRTAAVV